MPLSISDGIFDDAKSFANANSEVDCGQLSSASRAHAASASGASALSALRIAPTSRVESVDSEKDFISAIGPLTDGTTAASSAALGISLNRRTCSGSEAPANEPESSSPFPSETPIFAASSKYSFARASHVFHFVAAPGLSGGSERSASLNIASRAALYARFHAPTLNSSAGGNATIARSGIARSSASN